MDENEKRKSSGLLWALLIGGGVAGLVLASKPVKAQPGVAPIEEEPEPILFPSCDPDTCEGFCVNGICTPLILFTHKECNIGQCIDVGGIGEDQCQQDGECFQPQPLPDCQSGENEFDFNGPFCINKQHDLMRWRQCTQNNEWGNWEVIENCPEQCGQLIEFEEIGHDELFVTITASVRNISSVSQLICVKVSGDGLFAGAPIQTSINLNPQQAQARFGRWVLQKDTNVTAIVGCLNQQGECVRNESYALFWISREERLIVRRLA